MGLFMSPGMVGGGSVASQLSAYPNFAAYFEAGLGESTDPGPPVKVSQLVSPIYVAPAAVARTVPSPNDISTTDWTTSGASRDDATTLHADASAGNHYVLQSGIPGFLSGIESQFECEVWAGTHQYGGVQLQGASKRILINTSTGAVLGSAGDVYDVQITDLGSGHWHISGRTMTATAGTLLGVLCDSSGGTTFTTVGTETFHFTNFALTQYPITSPRNYVQTIDQATFANMPLRDTTGWGGGLESLQFVAAAGSLMSGVFAASMPAPWSVSFVFDWDGDVSAITAIFYGGTVVSSILAYIGTDGLLHVANGTAGGALSCTISAGKHIVTILGLASATKVYLDGALSASGGVGASALGTGSGAIAIGSTDYTAANTFDGKMRSIAVYQGDLDADGTRAGIESFLDARAGGGII